MKWKQCNWKLQHNYCLASGWLCKIARVGRGLGRGTHGLWIKPFQKTFLWHVCTHRHTPSNVITAAREAPYNMKQYQRGTCRLRLKSGEETRTAEMHKGRCRIATALILFVTTVVLPSQVQMSEVREIWDYHELFMTLKPKSPLYEIITADWAFSGCTVSDIIPEYSKLLT